MSEGTSRSQWGAKALAAMLACASAAVGAQTHTERSGERIATPINEGIDLERAQEARRSGKATKRVGQSKAGAKSDRYGDSCVYGVPTPTGTTTPLRTEPEPLRRTPLKTVERSILQRHPEGDRVVDGQAPEGADIPGRGVVAETIIERYVIEREEITETHEEMRRRWLDARSYIANHTERKLYERFRKGAARKLAKIRERPYRSMITIESIDTVAQGAPTYKVRFKAESALGDLGRSIIDVAYWEATIAMGQVNRTGRETDSTNVGRKPFGVHITRYDLRERRRVTRESKSG